MSDPQDFPIGSRVLVTHNPARDYGYCVFDVEARRANAGKNGVLRKRSAAHCVYYRVDHDGGPSPSGF